MSFSEISVSLFGLFLGYWIISKLMADNKAQAIPYQKLEEEKGFNDDYVGYEKDDGRNWYLVLGVNRNAAIEEIQSAYKSLMLQYHPNQVSNLSEELRVLSIRKSKAINFAYKKALDFLGRGS